MNGDEAKLRSALTLLYHLRGIPVLLYGTEMGLQGHENHGAIRENMPEFDSKSPDYTKTDVELLNLCQELGELRKERTQGTFKQHVPHEGWVVLSWENDLEQTVLVLNATDKARSHEQWAGVHAQFESANGGALFEPWEAKVYHLN
jgi:glycosidase